MKVSIARSWRNLSWMLVMAQKMGNSMMANLTTTRTQMLAAFIFLHTYDQLIITEHAKTVRRIHSSMKP